MDTMSSPVDVGLMRSFGNYIQSTHAPMADNNGFFRSSFKVHQDEYKPRRRRKWKRAVFRY